MSINSPAIARRLRAAELPDRAAEEIALVLQEMQDDNLKQVATKEFVSGEIAALRVELRADIDNLRLELLAEIAKLRTEMLGENNKLRAETHGEIAKLRAEFLGEINKLRADVDINLERLKHDMTLRMGAMIAAAVAVLGGLNIFF